MPDGQLLPPGSTPPATTGGGAGLPPALPDAPSTPPPNAPAPDAPSSVAGAAGGGALVQPPTPTTPPAPVTPPPVVGGGGNSPVQSPMQAPPGTVAGTSGGGPVDMAQLVPVIQQLVSTLTALTTALQNGATMPAAQAQAGAGAAQGGGGTGVAGDAGAGAPGTTSPAPVEGGGANSPVQQVPPTGGCTCAKAAGEAAGAKGKKGKGDKKGKADKGDKPGGGGNPGQVEGGSEAYAAAKAGKKLSQQQIIALIREIASKNGADPDLMVAVARVESGLRPDAVGDGGTSFGLFQDHIGGAGGKTKAEASQYLDPLKSIEHAVLRFKGAKTAEDAYNVQRPADRAGYIAKVNAALKTGSAQLNAPVQ